MSFSSFLLERSGLVANITAMLDDSTQPGERAPILTWVNVAIASSFILINGMISIALGLQLEKSLIIASVRCLVQLTIMGYILEDVFKAKNPIIVMIMSCVLVLLGAYETVYNKSKQTYRGMFPSVLVSTAGSTLLIGVIGSKWALHQSPFWVPETFIPTIGMLLGNMMSGMAIALSSCLSSVGQRKEQIETYLAFGASRWEAGQSIAIEAVRLAMLPTINQMSVIGLVCIPGMMTGQILGGVPVMNAVRYQQIIMFLISASTALGVLGAVMTCIRIMIDNQHRLRPEKIIQGKASVFHDIKLVFIGMWHIFKRTVRFALCCLQRKEDTSHLRDNEEEQRQPLLQ